LEDAIARRRFQRSGGEKEQEKEEDREDKRDAFVARLDAFTGAACGVPCDFDRAARKHANLMFISGNLFTHPDGNDTT
jgi:hypothetical protein